MATPLTNILTYHSITGNSIVVASGDIPRVLFNSIYRQITLAEPATGDLLTWLEANAVRLPLTGTWVFNSAVTNNSSTNRGGVFTFTSNGTAYNGITLTGTGSSLTVKYNAATVYSSGAWSDSAYRTITFTQPVKYEGNEEFVRWFVDNAVPAGGG